MAFSQDVGNLGVAVPQLVATEADTSKVPNSFTMLGMGLKAATDIAGNVTAINKVSQAKDALKSLQDGFDNDPLIQSSVQTLGDVQNAVDQGSIDAAHAAITIESARNFVKGVNPVYSTEIDQAMANAGYDPNSRNVLGQFKKTAKFNQMHEDAETVRKLALNKDTAQYVVFAPGRPQTMDNIDVKGTLNNAVKINVAEAAISKASEDVADKVGVAVSSQFDNTLSKLSDELSNLQAQGGGNVGANAMKQSQIMAQWSNTGAQAALYISSQMNNFPVDSPGYKRLNALYGRYSSFLEKVKATDPSSLVGIKTVADQWKAKNEIATDQNNVDYMNNYGKLDELRRVGGVTGIDAMLQTYPNDIQNKIKNGNSLTPMEQDIAHNLSNLGVFSYNFMKGYNQPTIDSADPGIKPAVIATKQSNVSLWFDMPGKGSHDDPLKQEQVQKDTQQYFDFAANSQNVTRDAKFYNNVLDLASNDNLPQKLKALSQPAAQATAKNIGNVALSAISQPNSTFSASTLLSKGYKFVLDNRTDQVYITKEPLRVENLNVLKAAGVPVMGEQNANIANAFYNAGRKINRMMNDTEANNASAIYNQSAQSLRNVADYEGMQQFKKMSKTQIIKQVLQGIPDIKPDDIIETN